MLEACSSIELLMVAKIVEMSNILYLICRNEFVTDNTEVIKKRILVLLNLLVMLNT